MHTLLFHQPGHFHAALLLKWRNPRVDRTVHVYATPGPDLDRFLSLVAGFNSRSDDPTDWDLRLHTQPHRSVGNGADPLQGLIDDRLGELVVVAGRNQPKLAALARLHQAGFAVLADKPWIVGPGGLADLDQVTAGPPIAMDIMTGRHDVVNRLSRRIVASEDLFGDFARSRQSRPSRGGSGGGGREPDLEFGSVHHLCKVVDGRPLTRPPWYYDVTVQGDGMVDIHSHLVDQAQWVVEARQPLVDGGGVAELTIERALRWSTPVPLIDFSESTGLAQFPPKLMDRVTGHPAPVLDLACNGSIDYRIGDVSVRQEAVWRARTPPGGSDLHSFTARGTGCTLKVRQGPATDGRTEVHLLPADRRGRLDPLTRQLEGLQDEFPGLAAIPIDGGHRLTIPSNLATPHETMFGRVLDEFLDRFEAGAWSASLADTIRARYRLLAAAHLMAVGQHE